MMQIGGDRNEIAAECCAPLAISKLIWVKMGSGIKKGGASAASIRDL